MHESKQKADRSELDPTDRLIVDELSGVEQMDAKTIQARLRAAGRPLTQSSLSRRLRRLIDAEQVVSVGKGPATAYRRHPRAKWFSLRPSARPTVHYDPARLDAYRPNQSAWMSDADRARLASIPVSVHPAATYGRAIAEKMMVDLSFASSALEGNTYSYLDTETLVKYGQLASGHTATEARMILNHKDAVAYLIDGLADRESPLRLDVRTAREFQSLLMRDLIAASALGSLRNTRMSIGGSSYEPLSIAHRLHEELAKALEKASAIDSPFEASLFLLTAVPYIQPFLDGNKRAGRLLCNLPLLKAGLPPLSFMDMDKRAYVEGLLTYYELGDPSLICAAFVDAYAQSAHRYDVHAERDPGNEALDRHYRAELSAIVQGWVKAVAQDEPDRWRDVVAGGLGHVKDAAVKDTLARRALELREALNEGNRIVYGVSRLDYDAYAAKQAAAPRRKPRV